MSPRSVFLLALLLAALSAGCAVGAASSADGEPSAGPAAAAEDEAAEALRLMPADHRDAIAGQLSLAGENRKELLAAMAGCNAEQREGLAFLLANMPRGDLRKLSAGFLLENVAYAYKARGEVRWGGEIPQEIFLNHVLPYANVNERRDNWRKDFYERFMPIARECETPAEALARLNVDAFKMLKVRFHKTKRRKAHQSPYESTQLGFASCTGLSILLADACRAVGVPARVVGTPLWTNKSGNHTWVEIWDGQWHFIGAAEPGELNKAWFVNRAAAADPSKPAHRIYAASFERTETVFPLAWSPNVRDVFADDVTAFYTSRQPVTFRVVHGQDGLPVKATLTLRHNGRIVAQETFEGEAAFNVAPERDYDVHIRTPGRRWDIGQTVRIEKDCDQVVLKLD
ncbi:MAG: transglutaminase-like domain-containing protein [Planctomycetota bacterium]